MIRLTMDDTFLLKDLARYVEPVVISDRSGKLVGLFVPGRFERGKQRYPPRATPTDMKELARRSAEEKGGHTTREVFEYLKALTSDPQLQADLQQKIDRLVESEGCDTP